MYALPPPPVLSPAPLCDSACQLREPAFSPTPLLRGARASVGNNMAVMEPVANTGAFDCTFLDEISEETILENLRLRFKIGKVK